MDDKQFIHRAITNATVKVLVGSEFKGTGFFITSDGYILTAYHCIGEYPPKISVKTRFDGEFEAFLDAKKSLRSEEYDIAVLKISYQPSDYLPLGTVSKEHITDEIISAGYPASYIENNQELGFYLGNISRFRGNKIENDAMKGQGHSGGPVYHYKTSRVVGLVTEGYKSEVMLNTGLAARFDALFEKWGEFEAINSETNNIWDITAHKNIVEADTKLKQIINGNKNIFSGTGNVNVTIN